MARHLHILFAVCSIAVACSSSSGGPAGGQPSADVGADAWAKDVAAADRDAIQADAPEPDSGPDCSFAAACTALQRRLSDCSCVSIYDRRCAAHTDCRPDETCREMEDGEYRVCWYDPPPVRACPGSDCPASADSALLAAAAVRSVTPPGFEAPHPDKVDRDDGALTFDPRYIDDTEWLDCGLDGLCPGDVGWTAPDEGEGDGIAQAVWIAGFNTNRAAEHCPAERVGCERPDCCVSRFAHDDLEVRVVVFRQGGLTVAFGVVDAIGYFHTDIEQIRRAVSEKTQDVDLIVFASTHDHEAPDTSGQWGPGLIAPMVTGRLPDHMQRIVDQATDAIVDAVERLEPATVSAGVLDVGVDGLGVSDSRAPYIFDDNVPVVWVRSADEQRTIATMFSFASHAEVLWDSNTLLTSDYFHFARRYVEDGLAETTDVATGAPRAALPGVGGVSVMFAGAIGGLINPGHGGIKDYAGMTFDGHTWEAADALGQRLASHILGAIHGGTLTEVDDAALRFAHKRFLTSAENRAMQLAAMGLGLIQRDVYNTTKIGSSFKPGPHPLVLTEVAVVRLGPITFFTAPGEAFPELLVGGYPGKARVQRPVVGDVEERRVPAMCDETGLVPAGGAGVQPCIISPDQEYPPDWSAAPSGPYAYERIPGDLPFFIGLGFDFLGYMVPSYDYAEVGYLAEAPGSHYEETNGVGRDVVDDWLDNLQSCADAVR